MALEVYQELQLIQPDPEFVEGGLSGSVIYHSLVSVADGQDDNLAGYAGHGSTLADLALGW
jgi:hypothetical protein